VGFRLVSIDEPAPVAGGDLRSRILAIMEEIERSFPDADPDLFDEFRKGMDKELTKHADKVPRIHALCVEAMSKPMTDAKDASLGAEERAKAEALRGVENITGCIMACNNELHVVQRVVARVAVWGMAFWLKERSDGGKQERLPKVVPCVQRCLGILLGNAPQ